VALKLLDFQPLEPATRSFKRLQREARVAAATRHPNIVPVLDLGVSEGTPFIEMELVKGASLRERVRRGAPPPPEEACRLCLDALAGLQALHERRIVHGDIKPGNILLDTDGRARLTDFGIASFLEETTSLTGAGRVVGSPHFMAPEQWRGEHLSPPTDLYSTGLVLYYLLTGRLPYEGETHFTLMYKHLHEPVLAAGEVAPLVPDSLAQVIRRATDKLPGERFGSAEEFAEALRDAAGQVRGRAR
jgi:serine/threonine-protein kinase